MMVDPLDQRSPARRRPAFVALLSVVCLLLFACGDPEDASLCTAFEELVEAGAAVAAIDPTDQAAADATGIVEDYLAGVRRLEQAADGRYGQELDALESAVNDLLLTLESVPDDAEFATWGPLVEDDLELAADAAVRVEGAIGPSCVSETSETTEV